MRTLPVRAKATSYFSRIVILESLPIGTWRTFNQLRDDVEALNTFHERELQIDLVSAKTEQEFWSALTKLHQHVVSKEEYPILHIECEGSNDHKGLILADGTFIDWNRLKQSLTQLNIATKCNLFITLATCYGAYLSQIIHPTDRAPYWGMLAPTEAATAEDLLTSFSAFYKELFTSVDGDKALSALLSSDKRAANYYFATAQGLFKKTYTNYLLTETTGKQHWRRAKSMKQQLRNRNKKAPSTQELVEKLRTGERTGFAKYVQTFFMMDLYPENHERFRISYDDIVTESKTLNK